MARRGARGDAKQRPVEEVLLEERQVPGVFSCPAPAIWEATAPLRLLDQFTCFTVDAEGARTLHGLEELVDGEVGGRPLQASGLLLEHRLADSSVDEACAAAYARLQINSICDWVVDHSQPPAVWLVTEAAWYRLLRPAPEYAAAFGGVLLRSRMLAACVQTLQSHAGAAPAAAVAAAAAAGSKRPRPAAGGNTEWDPYSCAEAGPWGQAELAARAGWLLPQLAALAGRHAAAAPLLRGLAELGGEPLPAPAHAGRPLLQLRRPGRPADAALRPQPHTEGFTVAEALRPGVLMVWDFCQSFRQLLRLPPVPLARLEAAFGEAGPAQEQPLLRDLHLCLLRLLEGRDTGLQEAPTMAGYGAAAELGPRDVYRPLLPASWPELVRAALAELCAAEPASLAAAAAEQLRVRDYWQLPAAARLALLEALVHLTAGTELVRGSLQEQQQQQQLEGAGLEGGQPLGCDATGARYHQLGGSAGLDRLFVELRPAGLPEASPGTWGWYQLPEVAGLVAWLDGGCPQEQALADALHEAFALRAAAAACQQQQQQQEQEDGCLSLELPADGYAAAAPDPDPVALLRAEITDMFAPVHWWQKTGDWLRSRAALLAELRTARSAREFARLLWLVEDLMYYDLLRGTGWGRRRPRFREQLEAAHTIAQVAVEAAQMAVHCRRAEHMGLLSAESFFESLRGARVPPAHLPSLGEEAVLLRSGYGPHGQQARPPRDAVAPPLPRAWRFAERVRVREVAYVRGEWARPAWQGRFADGPAAPHKDAADLLLACLLVERCDSGGSQTEEAADDAGEINWEGFSWQTGYKPAKLPASQRPASASSLAAAAEPSPSPAPSSAAPVKQETAAAASSRQQQAIPKPEPPQQPSEARAQPKQEQPPPAPASGPAPMDAAPASPPARPAPAAEAKLLQPGVSGQPPPPQQQQQQQQQQQPAPTGQPAAAGLSNGVAAKPKPASNSVLFEMLKLPSLAAGQAKAAAAAAAAAAKAQPSLRRSSRARTEVSFSDYEAGEGDADAGAGHASAVQARAAMWLPRQQPPLPTPAVAGAGAAAAAAATAAAAAAAAEEAAEAAEEALGLRFWRRDRDIAGVVLYVRKDSPLGGVQFLLPPELFAAGVGRAWPAGTLVKMPAWGALPAAASLPNVRWHSGAVAAPFPPAAAPAPLAAGQQQQRQQGGGEQAEGNSQAPAIDYAVTDPWKGLTVRWDPGTLLSCPARVSPWEVLPDEGGAVRQANAQLYQQQLAKQQAENAARAAARPPAQLPGLPLAQLAAFGQFTFPLPGQLPGQLQGGAQVAGAAGQLPLAGWPGGALPGPYSLALQGFPGAFAARPPPAAALQPAAAATPPAAAAAAAAVSTQHPSGRKRRGVPLPEPEQPGGRAGRGSRGSNETYRDRWQAKKPRPNAGTWLSGFCSGCEQPAGGSRGPLLTCMGPCLRAFHPACVQLARPPAEPERWFCPECDSGRMRCFLCGGLGAGFGDNSVRKCSLGVCGRFYHFQCVKAAPRAQPAKKGGHFRCPQHYCLACSGSGDGQDMAKCIRCPAAYHSACMAGTAARRLHPQLKVVLCERHAADEPPPGYQPPPPADGAAAAPAAAAPAAAAAADSSAAPAEGGSGAAAAQPAADQAQPLQQAVAEQPAAEQQQQAGLGAPEPQAAEQPQAAELAAEQQPAEQQQPAGQGVEQPPAAAAAASEGPAPMEAEPAAEALPAAAGPGQQAAGGQGAQP